MTNPLGDFKPAPQETPYIHGRSLVYGLLFSIPCWGLIIAAVFSLVVRMILFALAVVLIAAKLPDHMSVVGNGMLLGAVGLVILGIVLTIDRWF